MFIAEREIDGIIILELSGKLMGGPDANALIAKLHELSEKGLTQIVADLANVSLINSSGLGIVISGLTTIRNSGGDLKLANVSERIKNLFTVTKLATVFEIADSVEDAIKSYKSGK